MFDGTPLSILGCVCNLAVAYAHALRYIFIGLLLIIFTDTYYANAAMNSPLDPREVCVCVCVDMCVMCVCV